MDPVVEARALAVLRAGMHPDLLKALASMNQSRPTATIIERIRKCTDNLQVLDVLIEHGAIADVGEPFSFKGREHWRPIARDMGGDRCVVMSSAQVGKTINVVYANYICGLRDALEGRPSWVGFYLPVQQMVIDFAKGRFDPILHKMREIVGGQDDGGRKSIENLPPAIRARAKAFMREAAAGGMGGEDAYKFKHLWGSIGVVGWAGSDVLVDGYPLSRVFIDEVRLIESDRVDRIQKRVSGLTSRGSVVWTSTAGVPGDAIAVRWEESTQNRWHHDCACPDGVILADVWPGCLGTRPNAASLPRNERHYLYCPRCGTEITEHTPGRWVEHNPGGSYPGYNPNQLIGAPPKKVAQLAEDWNRPDRVTREFYNSGLGLVFSDPSATPITRTLLESLVSSDIAWADPHDVGTTCMGIDHHGGVFYFVLCEVTGRGKRRMVHQEIVWGRDCFERAAELMRQYDVSICVLEPNPNTSGAVRFCNDFAGRAFLVNYTKNKTAVHAIEGWADATEDAAKLALVDIEAKTPYQVGINQTLAFDALAEHYARRMVEIPDPGALRQTVLMADGQWQTVETCRQIFFDHMTRMARREVVEEKKATGSPIPEETGRSKYHWVKIAQSSTGGPVTRVKGAATDPHFAFADLLSWVAWTRLLTQVDSWTVSW